MHVPISQEEKTPHQVALDGGHTHTVDQFEVILDHYLTNRDSYP